MPIKSAAKGRLKALSLSEWRVGQGKSPGNAFGCMEASPPRQTQW